MAICSWHVFISKVSKFQHKVKKVCMHGHKKDVEG